MNLNLCFHSFSRCDWFLAPFHECDENKQVDHDNKIHLFLSASDLQAFLVFSQHRAWVYCAGKPIESVVYCLNDARLRSKIAVTECTSRRGVHSADFLDLKSASFFYEINKILHAF